MSCIKSLIWFFPVERATPKQYHTDFDCDKVGFIQRLPQQWEKAPRWLRDQYLEKFSNYKDYKEDEIPSIEAAQRRDSLKNADQMLKVDYSLFPDHVKFILTITYWFQRTFSNLCIFHL